MRPRRYAALALCLLPFLACGCPSNNKGKIEGTKWTSESAVMKGLQLSSGAVYFDFRKDYTLICRFGSKRIKGTYSLGWGDWVTLRLDEALPTGKVHTETVVIKGEHMTMTDSDGTHLTFRKWD
jgi:hypothetical protein